MADFQLTTPVAFIIFNRPGTTACVFAEIAKAKPSTLLVVADGPRSHCSGEDEQVAHTRAIIDHVDWECDVRTHYSDINLGCKQRVSTGLDWVFEQVPEAIILEDDCVPEATFFRYCQELLERYRDDHRVGMIGGVNFQFGHRYNSDSYYFSKYMHIWGWASWRDRWRGTYDVAMTRWPSVRDSGTFEEMVGDRREARYWKSIFNRVHRGDIDTWDYQWMFANWTAGRMSVIPAVNMITNVGFDSGATHTRGDSELANLEQHAMRFPLKHPHDVRRNIQADRMSDRRCFRVPAVKRLRNKVSGWIRQHHRRFRRGVSP